jgi:membrane protein YdbS with pleckstrin-like domain
MLEEAVLQIISATIWVVVLLVALIVIPHYFIHSKVVLTDKEIAAASGFITYKNDYMPLSSVKSVSVIITPLGGLTGFNFVIVNALGARMLLCFLKKRDVIMISKHINELILSRQK